VELRQLRSLIAVSEEGSFIGASRRLRIAQPALSRQIRNLERELGTAVFVRARSGVTLTPAGEICLRAAHSLIGQTESGMRDARMASAGKVGTCTMYVSQWCVWTGFTGKVLAHLAIHDPGIDVIIKEGQIGTQWECLRRGHVDLSIATPPPQGYDDIQPECLFDDVAGVAVLAPSHALAGRKSLRLEELANETFLTYDSNVLSTLEQQLESAFRSSGFTPGKVRRLESTESLIARVSAGLGWTVHRKSLLGRIPDVVTVPIEDLEFPLPVTLMRRTKEMQPHVLEVARRIREVAAMEYPAIYHRPPAEVHLTEPSWLEPLREGQVEIRDLRYFAAVIEEQGIGRAAVRLGLAQPGLSRQIRSLEREVGVSLLARATRGIVPTAAGSTLYKSARKILGDFSRLPAEVERGQRAAAGRCVIAALPSGPVRDILSSVMRTVSDRFPHLELSVINIPTPQQPAAIHDGEFDIGLCHPFFSLTAGHANLECRELISDHIEGALLPENHPLTAKKKLRFEDLAEIPFLFFRRDFHPAFHDFVFETFRKTGYQPVLGPTQNGLHTLWSMAEAGAGWSLAFGYHRSHPPAGLRAVPVEGFKVPWGVNLLSRGDETRPSVLAVIDLLLEEAMRRNRPSHSTPGTTAPPLTS
jgi:DNA-binding transcriptional LysR family regulator